MDESKDDVLREELFSTQVKAGRRTYFFDVKETRTNERYITITESKKKFDNEKGKFIYEKHKLFLYKEDFEKFVKGITDAVTFVETGVKPEIPEIKEEGEEYSSSYKDIEFEDLGDK